MKASQNSITRNTVPPSWGIKNYTVGTCNHTKAALNLICRFTERQTLKRKIGNIRRRFWQKDADQTWLRIATLWEILDGCVCVYKYTSTPNTNKSFKSLDVIWLWIVWFRRLLARLRKTNKKRRKIANPFSVDSYFTLESNFSTLLLFLPGKFLPLGTIKHPPLHYLSIIYILITTPWDSYF